MRHCWRRGMTFACAAGRVMARGGMARLPGSAARIGTLRLPDLAGWDDDGNRRRLPTVGGAVRGASPHPRHAGRARRQCRPPEACAALCRGEARPGRRAAGRPEAEPRPGWGLRGAPRRVAHRAAGAGEPGHPDARSRRQLRSGAARAPAADRHRRFAARPGGLGVGGVHGRPRRAAAGSADRSRPSSTCSDMVASSTSRSTRRSRGLSTPTWSTSPARRQPACSRSAASRRHPGLST
jgi:hypothetical protein